MNIDLTAPQFHDEDAARHGRDVPLAEWSGLRPLWIASGCAHGWEVGVPDCSIAQIAVVSSRSYGPRHGKQQSPLTKWAWRSI